MARGADLKPNDPAVAIEARGINKTFRIPHDFRSTFREHFLHPFKQVDYETNHALRDVGFDVAKGETFGIVGRNGSGKSTLLKILSGIYRADSGTVRVDGMLSPFIELGVGFNPELSGRDNVTVAATLLGLSKDDLRRRYDEIIAFAELERFVDTRLKNYSSGMQVRLAYAVAIQAPFDVLVLDEVFAVGDAAFQQKCLETFEDFRNAGKTIVLVSHSPEIVERYCDRALLLDGGVLADIGPAADVVARYLERQGVDKQKLTRPHAVAG